MQQFKEGWRQCLVAHLLDYRVFSVRTLQLLIDTYWNLRGEVSVMGRQRNFYVLRFQDDEDKDYIKENGPWSMQGALLVTNYWCPIST